MPSEVATLDQPAISPSGRYTLVVNAEQDALGFELRLENGDTVFRSEDRFDRRHTTHFLWGDEDRVWVYSGDLGTFFWQQSQEDPAIWTKSVYAQSDVPAPEFLKRERPKWHKL